MKTRQATDIWRIITSLPHYPGFCEKNENEMPQYDGLHTNTPVHFKKKTTTITLMLIHLS